MQSITEDLSEDALAARLAAFTTQDMVDEAEGAAYGSGYPSAVEAAREAHQQHVQADVQQATAAATEKYRFVRPFATAADGYIETIQNSEGRLMLGLREIDMMTRGHGDGELVYITGYTHSGKTQVFLGAVNHNRDVPMVLFTMDEPAELVLSKLVSIRMQWNAEWVEDEIKKGNTEVIRRVRGIARDDFANLVVVDDSLSLGQMAEAMKEAEDYFGRRIAGVGIDYLELLRSDETEVEKKSQELKRWTKDVDAPVLCLHQGSRGNAGKGQRLTMQSMKYGGEQEAIMVIGVRRQRDNEDLDEWERKRHDNTVDVSVLKNKRPPSKKGEHTYFMDPQCGLIRTLQDGDLDVVTQSAAAQAISQRRSQSPGQRDIYGDEEPF